MQTRRIKRPWLGYLIALGVTALAAIFHWAIPNVFSAIPFLAFYPAVATAALLGGFGPGMAATVIASLSYIFWLDPTFDGFRFDDPADDFRIAFFFAGGTIVSLLARMQHKAQSAFEKSELFYRQTLESSPGMVFTTRPDGYCDYQSQQWADYSGVPMSEQLGDGWNNLLHPDDRLRAYTSWRAAVEERAPYDLEYRIRRHDGRYEWFKVNGRPIRDPTGRIIRWFGVALNIEELKRSQEVIRDSEERLLLTLQASNLGWWYWDYRNDAFMFDNKAKEFIGRPADFAVSFEDIVNQTHEDDRARLLERAAELRNQHSDQEVEFRVIWPDGTMHWLFARGRSYDTPELKPAYGMGIVTDITARKQTEDALRYSEQRLRANFDNAAIGILEVDEQSRIIAANQHVGELLGYECERLLGMRIHDLTAPEDRPQSDELNAQLHAGHLSHFDYEKRYLKSDGSPVWVHVTVSAVRDSQGHFQRAIGTVEDISKRKAAEEDLRRSEDHFRGIVQASAAAVWTADSEGRVVDDSPSWRAFTGQTFPQYAGYGWLEAIHPDDRSQTGGSLDAATQGKEAFLIEYRLWHAASHSYRNTLVRSIPLFNPDGRLREWIGMNIDVTELRQSEERLRLAQKASHLGIWDWNLTSGESVLSEECFRLWGLEPQTEPIVQDWFELIHPDDRGFTRQLFTETVEQGVLLQGEYRIIRQDGEVRWLMTLGNVIEHDASHRATHLSGITLDVTERKIMEEELKSAIASAERAKAAAEQASRAKDHFLAVLSHELRTPLTPVVMGVSMLQDRPDLAPEVRETLEMVHRNVEMEARLIDDLLDVTRIARGKIELSRTPVELCTVIHRAVEVCRSDLEARRLHFGIDLGPRAPYWIEADVPRLQQVFWNLLKNAIKFTPHGGCVGIRCVPNQKHVVVEVNDSGIGIEQDSLSRIFNAFEQAERSITRQFGGLGLGLAISKALVEMHGGEISAHSEGRGKGTSFRIQLPLAAPASQPERPMPAAPPQRVTRSLHILLVEDHGVTAKMIQMVLKAEGHSVELAGDLATAIMLADNNGFDLLLSDLGLPDGSGHDLMRQLRGRGHQFPAIALSGYGQEEDIHRSRQAGFAAHLTKPASREAVVQTIAAIMGKEDAFDANGLSTATPKDASVFDVQAALEFCFGDQEMLAQMIQYFFDDYDTILPQIHAALERGDLPEMGKLGHRIKGTIAHLGAHLAAEAAAQVERAGIHGRDAAEAREAVRWLDRECQLLKAALADYQSQ